MNPQPNKKRHWLRTLAQKLHLVKAPDDGVLSALHARQKYRHFRILVIGRANAGKTTVLQRVCNTTEDPCIYDEEKNVLEPTSMRGIHDIKRPFAFKSNPQFIFHDSPGFETADENQLKQVKSFLEERAKATEVEDQLHAIWFCFAPEKARFLLELEKRFFNEPRPGNVPVIAIHTKFDDLIKQVDDPDREEDEIREVALKTLENLKAPLLKSQNPPRAHIRLEQLQDDDGNHQDQVKELIEKTSDSLDNLALKILFVSVQQNNLELCIRYAVENSKHGMSLDWMVKECLLWFRHSYYDVYDYVSNFVSDTERET